MGLSVCIVEQPRLDPSPLARRFAGFTQAELRFGSGFTRRWRGRLLGRQQHCQNRRVGVADRSTPTRLTMLVTVPSASASTHAARCSRPRCGKPGSKTQPDAAPSIRAVTVWSPRADGASSGLVVAVRRSARAVPRTRPPRCPPPEPGRRCPVGVYPAIPPAPRKWWWSRATREVMRRGRPWSEVGPTLWWSPATDPRRRSLQCPAGMERAISTARLEGSISPPRLCNYGATLNDSQMRHNSGSVRNSMG